MPTRLLVGTAKEAVEHFDDVCTREKGNWPFSPATVAAIEKHRKSLDV